jgi:hypothetical protein
VAHKVKAESEAHQDLLDAKIEKLIVRRYLRPLKEGEYVFCEPIGSIQSLLLRYAKHYQVKLELFESVIMAG